MTQSAPHLSKEGQFEESSQDPLDILDPVMGPMGFVMYDILIGTHKQWWPVTEAKPHIIPTLLEEEVFQL